jgi:diguanylate cyclase (GGDEF)-like protein
MKGRAKIISVHGTLSAFEPDTVSKKLLLKHLVMPGGLILLAVSILMSSGALTLGLPALNFVYYCAILAGMLLAWRFHSSRIFSALCVLFLAESALAAFGLEPALLPTTTKLVALLVAVDFALIALVEERGFSWESITPLALFLFTQCLIVAAVCRSAESRLGLTPGALLASTVSLPNYALFTLFAVGALLLVRFFMTGKQAEIALFWSLLSFVLSVHFAGNPRLSTLYSATAAAILFAAIIENSYLLAYHDELTTLPGRRAFNDAMLRLQGPFAIAVVDIDHFKNFNDTYGHDTGDQVLRLVASNLAHVTGGGRAYRCGGEEFTILFPGKNTGEVIEHLEILRRSIESSAFRMRGNDRRQSPRGPDRRNPKSRRTGDKQKTQQFARDVNSQSLSVTVSIGVASSSKRHSIPDSVLQAADKALYRAKANGRNRVETSTASPRRSKEKAAGIA